MKRFISVCLTLIMCLSLAVPALAVEGQGTRVEDSAPSEHDIANYALNFMSESQDNDNLAIKDFTRLYLEDGQISGYYVTFRDRTSCAGYVLLSLLTEGTPVVEFAFEGEGPLGDAELQMNSLSGVNKPLNIDEEKNILYTGPGEIYLPVGNNDYYSVYDQAVKTVYPGVSVASNITIGGGIIDWDDSNVNSSSVFKIKNFGAGTDYWLMTDFSSGGVCCPTAATNILWYWGKMRGCSFVMDKVSSYTTNRAKATAIFNTVSRHMGTNADTGTKDIKVYAGYSGFFGELPSSGNWNYKHLSNGTSFGSFKTELNGHCPIHLMLHTKNTLLDKCDGHSVMAFGYATSNIGTPYLFVMDGWNSYGRFVKFNYYPYVAGYKIWVK